MFQLDKSWEQVPALQSQGCFLLGPGRCFHPLLLPRVLLSLFYPSAVLAMILPLPLESIAQGCTVAVSELTEVFNAPS